MYYCPQTEAQRGQDTDRWSGPRLEPTHSGFIPWLFPLLQVPPRKCPAGSSRPSETLAWLCLWEDQSKTPTGPSHPRPQHCFSANSLDNVARAPLTRSQTRPLHWPRTQPQGLLWTPHSNHPGKESPGSICTWCLSLLGGHCHVPLVLSSPSGRHNYHRLSSCPFTEPRNNMLCDVSHLPIDPDQAHASPCSPADPAPTAQFTALPAS